MKVLKRVHKAMIMGGICGIVIFLFIYGYKIIDVTYTDWLYNKGDLTQNYIGGQFFRNSRWYFPLGLMDSILYPDKTSIVYMDAIPIAALISKALSPILPVRFQYMGLWGIINYTLQGMVSACILQKYIRKWLPLILGTVILTFSPWMIQRFNMHTALSSHWIIMLCILLCIQGREMATRKFIIYWSLLFAVAPMVHVYFIPICTVFLGCLTLYRIIARRKSGRNILVQLGAALIPIICSLFTLWVIGAFYGSAIYPKGTLGEASANLNFLFNSMNSSAFFPALPYPYVKWTSEGYGYLGLGGFFLLFSGGLLTITNKNMRSKAAKHCLEIGFTLLLLFIFLWMTTSPRVVWNDHILFYWIIPYPIQQLLRIFLSLGRYVWPICYILLLLGVLAINSWSDKGVKGAVAAGLLFVVFSLQVMDLKPHAMGMGGYSNKCVANETVHPELWDTFTDSYKHIYVFSTDNWDEIGSYAAEHGLTMSDMYTSRKNDQVIIERNYKTAQDQMKGIADPDTIYILPANIEQQILHSLPDLNIYQIDGMYVATVNPLTVDPQYVLKLSTGE